MQHSVRILAVFIGSTLITPSPNKHINVIKTLNVGNNDQVGL